ncbi:hypothetical protein U1Q18_037558 [Sarracenia purpurea var. burkii]
MSRDIGSTSTTSSSSLVAKELDAVNVNLPLFEGQRSPAKLNNEVKVGEMMNHLGVSSSPTGLSSPAKISQRCKKQPQSDTQSEWVKVGKGKATVSNFIVAPLVHVEPSSSNLPVIQEVTPEVDNLAPPSSEQYELQGPQIEEHEQDDPDAAAQVILKDTEQRDVAPSKDWESLPRLLGSNDYANSPLAPSGLLLLVVFLRVLVACIALCSLVLWRFEAVFAADCPRWFFRSGHAAARWFLSELGSVLLPCASSWCFLGP